MIAELLTSTYAVASAGAMALKYQDMMLYPNGLPQTEGEVKGVELYTPKDRVSPPVYVGGGTAGVGIGVPIGGGSEREYNRAHSSFTDSKGTTLRNYWAPNDPGRIFWINTAEQLTNVANQHAIDLAAFPVQLPMRVHEHVWKGPVWYDQRSGRIGPRKSEIARAAVWARRWPLTATAGVVAAALLLANHR